MTNPTPSLQALMALVDPAAKKDASQFAAKLNFDQRCQILALEWMGFSRRLTAAAYGVNRSTVNFIVTPSSPHYKNVRRKFTELGREAFILEYVTPEVIEFVNSFKTVPEVAMTSDELKETKAEAKKAARAAEGVHRLRDARFDQSYVANVTWFEFDNGDKGWALWLDGKEVAKLLGGDPDDTPTFHYNSDPEFNSEGAKPELFMTSKAALDAWKQAYLAEDA